MSSSLLFGTTTFGYLFATFLYILILIFKLKKIGGVATGIALLSFLVQTSAIGLRWIESYQLGMGHSPLTNMYESVVFFSWTIMLLYLYLEFKYKTRTLGAFIVPFAFAAMAYGSLSSEINRSITPLIPALQSNWLISHVVSCFIGYAAFAIASGLGFTYLAKQKFGQNKTGILANVPNLDIIDDILYKTMIFGFIWLSTGIITGSVWANTAWGTYWNWDPKETWSLITWFFYAVTLHAKYTRDWSGERMAWMSIAGLFCVLFTYYGVNFMLSGLHSYGSS